MHLRSAWSWDISPRALPLTFVFLDLVGHLAIMNHFTASCLLILFDLLYNKFTMSFNDYFQFNTSDISLQTISC